MAIKYCVVTSFGRNLFDFILHFIFFHSILIYAVRFIVLIWCRHTKPKPKFNHTYTYYTHTTHKLQSSVHTVYIYHSQFTFTQTVIFQGLSNKIFRKICFFFLCRLFLLLSILYLYRSGVCVVCALFFVVVLCVIFKWYEKMVL